MQLKNLQFCQIYSLPIIVIKQTHDGSYHSHGGEGSGSGSAGDAPAVGSSGEDIIAVPQ